MGEIETGKSFFEVFPTLKVSEKLEKIFQEVQIEKITTNSTQDFLHIHIHSTHVIPKSDIYLLEKQIFCQLFANTNIQVQICERYTLSRQYTPSELMKEYHDSILLELKKKSVLASSMFEQAEIRFEDENILYLGLADTVVSSGRQEMILELLQQVFNERFQMPAKICTFQKEDKKTLTHRTYEEQRIQKQIDAIFERSRSNHHESLQNQNSLKDKKQKTDFSLNSFGTDKSEKEFSGKNVGLKRKDDFRSAKKFTKNYKRPLKQDDDPNLIFGKNFDDEVVPLSQELMEMTELVYHGKIIAVETREIRNERTIVTFKVTDFTDTIIGKIFVENEDLTEILGSLKKNSFVKVKGVVTLDQFEGEMTIGSVRGIKRIPDFTTKREDLSPVKRVELHCHTQASDMDGVTDVKIMVGRAHDWGHPAIAITDHGVAHAFPDANHYIERLDKNDSFKVIYGIEGYVVDDLTDIAVGAGEESLMDTFVVFDLETTGFSSIKDKIIEIGAVKVTNGQIVDKYSTFVNPRRPIPFEITQLTGITDDMVMEAPDIETVLPEFLNFIDHAVLVAHNAGFDVGFLEQNCRYQDIESHFIYVDTVSLSRIMLPTLSKYKLNHVAKALGISLENHHRAVDDAGATAEIFIKLVKMLQEANITTLKELNRFGNRNLSNIQKLPTYHIIILAKNNIGRLNLYKLISESHLTYYARRPRIPKSLLNEYREGLIIGSACEAGELFQAILNHRSPERIAKIADFYDYYEIQPIGNNRFLLGENRFPDIQTEEDLRNLNRQIVSLGEKFKKPVAATCDVHFIDPEDEVYRRIIMAGKGFKDADNQAPLYLRTTEEMLEEFSYLGTAKAYEVVVENTNKIAAMIEKISPVNPNKCPPVIENSDQQLRDICYKKAHKIYGETLPEQVSARLERELNSIISNGYAVMYIIAQKLVWKSNADGYLVGSRGSVGSSFVATMAGITEVNPLSPHYYCPNCHYHDFDSEEVKSYAGSCGFDMPDKPCPVCGSPLKKEGFDIPFETFLGFKGDKEPDIDLNFSGDYQGKAHKYTEVIFGEGHTFKAGTIATVADKTAYGYVKNYYEERGIKKRKCEIERLSQGCTGIRRSTGQHPGGIVVLPHGHNINEFTPVQHPANEMGTDIITTHFDYHSIDHNLLKLDILGHDDPTMIRMLEEYITSDALENEYNSEHPFQATNIPLDDKKVLSLFHDTSALGIKPEDISGCKLGSLGIPEFGTDFVIQMVQDANPQSFSDLVRISGLSHGTNVWLGNAQDLIKEGKATISTAICTRDDIMLYLINKGVDSALSFKIMESVRKGKGLTPEWEEAMREKDVPEWYIGSCKKISYMFPKAHAAAYVMMAYRIAYCKINYPLAYYGAYFSIRADAFSYNLMCQGKEALNHHMDTFRKKGDAMTNKEQDILKDMKLVQEMYARGFEFLPIDLYKAKAKIFQIIDGKLMPSFASIEGMGEKAAEAVELAAKDGKYLSLDDFRERTKVSKTVIEQMEEMGLFGNLPKSNQLSLFDL